MMSKSISTLGERSGALVPKEIEQEEERSRNSLDWTLQALETI